MSLARPPASLHLLADDLTGALDSAAAFRAGMPVYLDRVPEPSHDDRRVAVATPTRDIAPQALAHRLEPLLPWLKEADLPFKKVDSLLRGNSFAECAHIARAAGFGGLVFAPAFPAQRRLTHAGRHGVADGPSVSIVEALAAVGIASVCSSAGERPVLPVAGPASGPVAWVPDVQSDQDLDRIVAMALAGPEALPGRWLWCGSAGLAHAVARAMDLTPAPADQGMPPRAGPMPGPRRVLMLGASHHEVVRRQWQRLRSACAAFPCVASGDDEQFARACRALVGPFELAALELSPRAPLTPDQAASLLRHQMQALTATQVEPLLLLVIGGDSLLSLCEATGVQGLRTLDAARPGWGHARLMGGRWDGLECHSRSGAFGGEDDLVDMLKIVTSAHHGMAA